MENLPEKIDDNQIVVEINNATLIDSTWIISGFLKELERGSIDHLTFQKTIKGDHSFDITLIAHYINSESVFLINRFVDFVLNGEPYLDDAERFFGVVGPIYRVAKYIAKRRNSHFNAKVNDKNIFYPKMNKRARDRILKDDNKQLHLEDDKKRLK